MFSTRAPERRKVALLIVPTLGAVLAGTGMAMAQPGSDFQDRGIREAIGIHHFPRASFYVMRAPTVINRRDRAVARYLGAKAKWRR